MDLNGFVFPSKLLDTLDNANNVILVGFRDGLGNKSAGFHGNKAKNSCGTFIHSS
jgi:hypothetical protein